MPGKSLVRVLIFSENPDFRIRAKKYLFPRAKQYFSDFDITVDPSEDADVVVVLDPPRQDQYFRFRKGFLWFWQLEANLRADYLGAYDQIFGQREAVARFGGIAKPPMTDWLLDYRFEQLASMGPPEKTRMISLVSSRKSHLPGHRVRNAVFDELEIAFPEMHVFGSQPSNYVKNKEEALFPYKYSIVIENTKTDDYITEKLIDCFLSYTLPIYFGAPNHLDYYPDDSVISLPNLEPSTVRLQVGEVLSRDPWENHVEALTRARGIFLRDWSIYGMVSELVKSYRDQILQQPFVSRKVFGTTSFRINLNSRRYGKSNDVTRFKRHFQSRLFS